MSETRNVVTLKEYIGLVRRADAVVDACRPFLLDDQGTLVGEQGGDFIVRIPSSAFVELRRAIDHLSGPATPEAS